MSILSSVTQADPSKVKGEDKDVLGGGGFILDTDVYEFTIKAAFLTVSDGGAIAMNIHAETDEGRGYRETIYFTNKKKETTFIDKKTEEVKLLPGFVNLTSFTLLTVGKEIHELREEEKVINLYDYDAGKELPTKVIMLMDLIGQKVMAAVEKQVVDKNVKNNDGKYVPSGETREQNEIVKFFRVRDRKTKSEIELDKDIPEDELFLNRWLEKNKGEVKMKAKGTSKKASAKPGKPAAGNSAASGDGEKKSLFN